jgi:uncharacterized protein
VPVIFENSGFILPGYIDMTESFKRAIYLSLGGLFFMLGLIGVMLPLLPTTPFMILSATFLAKSSPRFHQMLLNNRWIGEDLRNWEFNRSMKRATKKRATLLIVISFSISIAITTTFGWIGHNCATFS